MTDFTQINRRAALGVLGAAIAMPSIGRAVDARAVKLTLPWLAQGATAFAYVGRGTDAYKKQGLDVQVARGYGSLAAAQAVAQKQFDFGIVSAGPALLTMSRGLPLVPLATVNYDTTMGILVRKDSPIESPAQLAGKRIGAVVTSAEFPFWPAYARKIGIDPATVEVVQMDNRVLERTLIDKSVDAITCIGSSSIPVVAAQNVEQRFFSFRAAGIAPYSNLIVTNADVFKESPETCKKMAAALLESLAYQLREPESTLDILIREVPELGVTATGRDNARLSQGILNWTVIAPEAMENGLGWSSAEGWKKTVELTTEFVIPPNTPVPPTTIADNAYAGQVKLSAEEWAKLKTSLAPYGKLLG